MNADKMLDSYDHDNAILLQKEKSELFFKNLHSAHQEKTEDTLNHLIDINTLIFKKLRSKLFPDRNLEIYSKHIYEAVLFSDEPMNFSFILSSSTAIKELPEIFHFIDTLNKFKTKPVIDFIFVEWPELKNIEQKNVQNTQNDLAILFDNTLSVLKNHLTHPLVKKISYENILHHMDNAFDLKNDENFITDLNWIENFYERENSYRYASPKQALFDLMARRLVTKTKNEDIAFKHHSQEKSYMVTTELNKRFLKCYRSECTILNISVRKYDE